MFSFGGFNCFNFSDTSICILFAAQKFGPAMLPFVELVTATSSAYVHTGRYWSIPIFMGLLYLSPIFSTHVGKSMSFDFSQSSNPCFGLGMCIIPGILVSNLSIDVNCHADSWAESQHFQTPNRYWWNMWKIHIFPSNRTTMGWKKRHSPGIGICSQRAEGGHFSRFRQEISTFFWVKFGEFYQFYHETWWHETWWEERTIQSH